MSRSTDQKGHWSRTYRETPAFFGEVPSAFAAQALTRFREAGARDVLELGCGQGRDTLLFAGEGLQVTALDYAERSMEEVAGEVQRRRLTGRVELRLHDVRHPLPFPEASFDACYSHMLLCMELSEAEVAFALREVHRVLRPGGLVSYSVRSTRDKHYRSGTHLGESLYDVGGFVVHFFSEEKIRRLAEGYDVLAIDHLEEGSLPRDLFVVSLRKAPGKAFATPRQEGAVMADPMGKFQEFFDATCAGGGLDAKTRNLLFLAASLAAGCDP